MGWTWAGASALLAAGVLLAGGAPLPLDDPVAVWLAELEISIQNTTFGIKGSQITLYNMQCRNISIRRVEAALLPPQRNGDPGLGAAVQDVGAACQAHWRTETEAQGGTVSLQLAGSGAGFSISVVPRTRGKAPLSKVSGPKATVGITDVQWFCAPRKTGDKLCDEILKLLSDAAIPLLTDALQDAGKAGLETILPLMIDGALKWFEKQAGPFLLHGRERPKKAAVPISPPPPHGADSHSLDWNRFRWLSLVDYLADSYLGASGVNKLLAPAKAADGLIALPSQLIAAVPTAAVPLPASVGSASVVPQKVRVGGLDTLSSLDVLKSQPGNSSTLLNELGAARLELLATVQLQVMLNQSGDVRGPPLALSLDAGMLIPTDWSLSASLNVAINRTRATSLNLNQLTSGNCSTAPLRSYQWERASASAWKPPSHPCSCSVDLTGRSVGEESRWLSCAAARGARIAVLGFQFGRWGRPRRR
jgi:hypothetical protein